jgi:hypothetical protein
LLSRFFNFGVETGVDMVDLNEVSKRFVWLCQEIAARISEHAKDDVYVLGDIPQAYIGELSDLATKLDLLAPLAIVGPQTYQMRDGRSIEIQRIKCMDPCGEFELEDILGYWETPEGETEYKHWGSKHVNDVREKTVVMLKRWIRHVEGAKATSQHASTTKSATTVPPTSDVGLGVTTGFLGGAELADALGIHATRRDAFFRTLERHRMSLGDNCWHEVREPRPNSPRFLYCADSPKLLDLATGYKTPKPA